MEETFAGLVTEVEKAVRPLGFRVEGAGRASKSKPIFPSNSGQEAADEGELVITIVRKGNVG